MNMTKQGVRDLSKQAVVLIEPGANITHRPHKYASSYTGCGLNADKYKMYRPLEPQLITCVGCLAGHVIQEEMEW